MQLGVNLVDLATQSVEGVVFTSHVMFSDCFQVPAPRTGRGEY